MFEMVERRDGWEEGWPCLLGVDRGVLCFR